MHIGNTEVEIVRCIIQELEGRGSSPEAYEDLLEAALYSENLQAVQLLMETGVDPNGTAPLAVEPIVKR